MLTPSYSAFQQFKSNIYTASTITKLSELMSRYEITCNITINQSEPITLQLPDFRLDNTEAIELDISILRKGEVLQEMRLEMPIGDYILGDLERMMIDYFRQELAEK